MKLEHEDPRVIDYVLGELPDDECDALEQALLDDDGENAAFREELLALTALAKESLAEEAESVPAPVPLDATIVDLDAQRLKRRARTRWALKVAAIVTLVGGLGAAVILPALGRAREAARSSHMQEMMAKADLDKLKTSVAQPAAVRSSLRPGDTVAPSGPAPAPAATPVPTNTASGLQNVEVGGGIRIEGDWYGLGRKSTSSAQGWTEQRTRLNFKAEYKDDDTDSVKSDGLNRSDFSFRSDYLTGFDTSGPPAVNAEQAVKEANESWGKKLAENAPAPAGAPARSVAQPASKPDPTATSADSLVARQMAALGYAKEDRELFTPEDDRTASQSYYQNEAGPAFQPTVPLSFKSVVAEPLSTFAADVDTASYTFVKRILQGHALPSADMVRPEEFINYFDYAYPQPVGEHPFSVTVDIAGCPWAPSHRLARVGIRGKAMDAKERPAANLVFLVDVSGSMESADKLPLVRESLKGLLSTLNASDRVGIVTYAGESRVALAPTSCERKAEIAAAIDSLQSGGSTNGADGINTAYELARRGMVPGGINRVLIATDGDFNVGVTSQEGLLQLITKEAKSGVFLSVLGFGMGNLMDSTLEMLADKGNGFYAYISDIGEARRVLVDKGLSAIATIAKDVKFQLEFNPAKVAYYRQVGYENRQLAAQDFNDDTKDAGDIGPGHTVTALYELVPAGQSPTPGVDPLKYQAAKPAPVVNDNPETMTVKLRYKQPEAQTSKLLEVPVNDADTAFDAAPQDFRFAAAVAAFAESLKGLQVAAPLAMEQIQALAESAKGSDPARQDFVDLVVTAKTLRK